MTPQVLGVISGTIVAVAVIAGAVVLCALGKIDGQTTIALVGVGVALIGGDAKALVALYAQPPAGKPTPAVGP